MKNMKYITNSVQNIKKCAKCMLQIGKLLMERDEKKKFCTVILNDTGEDSQVVQV